MKEATTMAKNVIDVLELLRKQAQASPRTLGCWPAARWTMHWD